MARRTPRVVLAIAAAIPLLLSSGPAAAVPAPDPGQPWKAPHWPQTQPWQRSGPSEQQLKQRAAARPDVLSKKGAPSPVDPQNWENPDHMTWDDYKKPPGTNWADPAKKGSTRTFKGALVLVDYEDQPFEVTQPEGSSIFGQPGPGAHDVPQDKVAQFYEDFLNKPGDLNRGHTIHEYWMEGSGGRYGVELEAFGAYRMPKKNYQYGIDTFQQDSDCPSGDACKQDLRKDAKQLWLDDVGNDVPKGFDFIFYLSAGQDESSTWQEFGPMKWEKKEDVSDEFGPPDDSMPNWANTRYVEWTSWASAASIWPNAVTGSSTQAESSGMGTFAHELSHILGIGDNYNNAFSNPPRRSYTGIWGMLSRGSFNGPGGPHSRFQIPATGGGSMGSHHMLRDKMKLEMVGENEVLKTSRKELAKSGVVVADVTARSAPAGKGGLYGLNVQLSGGDDSPSCDPASDPYCDGGGYNNYTVEVADRMGTDSFTPDSGVLISKTKNKDDAPFIWTVDANPQDIRMVDFVWPDGREEYITIGDYRQLSDAAFHAGTGSGSKFEHIDKENKLHFYVLGKSRNDAGALTYRVAVRSLAGAGSGERGVRLAPAAGVPTGDNWVKCDLPLTNSGSAKGPDVYRLKATAPDGWESWLPNEVVTARAGETATVTAYAHGTGKGELTVTATSESDPSKTAEAACKIG